MFTFIKAGFSRKKMIKYLNFPPGQIIKFFCLVLQNGFIMIQRYSFKSFFTRVFLFEEIYLKFKLVRNGANLQYLISSWTSFELRDKCLIP